LIALFLSIISLSTQDWDMFWSNGLAGAENFFGSLLWFLILTLVWGYACVGAGFVIYKILKQREFIKDKALIASLPLPEPL
jgi:hypothetical protein